MVAWVFFIGSGNNNPGYCFYLIWNRFNGQDKCDCLFFWCWSITNYVHMLSRFLWWRRYLLPQSTTVHHSHQLSVPSLLSLKMNHQINLPSPIEHPMCVYHQLKSGQKMQTLASQKSFICTTLLFFIMIIIYSCSLDFEYQKRCEALSYMIQKSFVLNLN